MARCLQPLHKAKFLQTKTYANMPPMACATNSDGYQVGEHQSQSQVSNSIDQEGLRKIFCQYCFICSFLCIYAS